MTEDASDSTSGIEPEPVIPTSTVTMYGSKIMLAFPWQKNTNPLTAFSAFQLADRRRTVTILNFGDAYVCHSRNNIADVFLKSDSEWMLTIDDDMIVPFGHPKWFKTHTSWHWMDDKFAGLNTLDRLLSHKKTLVGACYFAKHPTGYPVFAEGRNKEVSAYVRKGPHDEIIKTGWCGTGCLLIHRSVFLDIEKKYPLLARGPDGKGGNWFSPSEHKLADGLKRVEQMLGKGKMDGDKALKAAQMLVEINSEASRVSRLGVGEDVIFARRAAEAGHPSHVDLGLMVGHLGTCAYGSRNTFDSR